MPFNLDKLKQKKAECSVALVAAMKEQNEEKIEQALGDFAQYVGDAMSMAAEQHNGNAIDTVILATRGVRQLTQQETSFWEGFIQAAKASDVKQAINGLKDGIPVTFIDAVLDDVRKAHPLLNLINFRNGSMYTRYLYNKSGKPTIVWGDITSAITNELNGDIGYIDVALKKLSAFMYVPKDMLDLGPAWVDRIAREILTEYIALGTETSVVDGDGKDQFIGMTRDVSKSAAVIDGVYPRKTAVILSELTPLSVGKVLRIVATDVNGDARAVNNPIFVVNPFDYFEKVMPATTVKNPDGTYRNDALPYPMTIVQSAAVPVGYAIMGIAERYLAILGVEKGGKIEHSDEYRFLADERTYKVKLQGNGRPLDENAFVLLDISELEPAALEVIVKNKAEEPVYTQEVAADETGE